MDDDSGNFIGYSGISLLFAIVGLYSELTQDNHHWWRIILIPIFFLGGIYFLYYMFLLLIEFVFDTIITKRDERKEVARIEVEKRVQEKDERAELFRQQKEAEIAHYQQLRKEIEAMPKYANWRNDVFIKNGRKCEMRGEIENLEIHHRRSFYSIIKTNRIENIAQAIQCDVLWQISNGEVLCKKCHAEMESSKYHQQKV